MACGLDTGRMMRYAEACCDKALRQVAYLFWAMALVSQYDGICWGLVYQWH